VSYPYPRYVLFALAGYLSGSILFAYWIPRLLLRIDTAAASEDGNPGVFNAFRYGGKRCGIPALVCEIAKGCVPVSLSLAHLDPQCLLFALVMAAPVLGHAFPVWHRFRGGKSIAVSFGVVLGLFPETIPFLLLAGLYIFFSALLIVNTHLWRSIVVFNLFGAGAILFVATAGIRLGCLAVSGIVAARHLGRRRGEALSVRPFWRRAGAHGN